MYKRKSAQQSFLPRLIVSITGISIFLISLLYASYRYIAYQHIPKGRYSLVFFGDPVELASYEPVTKRWTIVQFPLDTTIRGVRGYGDYRLEGLWRLAATEATPSGVVLESITDEFAVPVDRYLTKKGSPFPKHDEDQLLLPSLAGFGAVINYIRGNWEPTIPLSEFIALSRLATTSSTGPVTVYRLQKGKGLVEKIAPDGTIFLTVDRDAVDQLTQSVFEDLSMRKERMRITIYNTTGQPALGSRVARILSKMGANVVSVGNDTKEVSRCILEAKKDILSSYTAHTIESLFACDPKTVEETEQGDITIRLGTDYAKKFIGK